MVMNILKYYSNTISALIRKVLNIEIVSVFRTYTVDARFCAIVIYIFRQVHTT